MNKTQLPYTAFDNFVLRTPLFPFQFYLQLTSDQEIGDDSFKNLFTNDIVQEAIFLASPTLFFELEKWIKGDLEAKKEEKVKLSFLKYLSRMSSRCTPFGLFAGCTLGTFAEKTDLFLKPNGKHERFTRPDMNYLVALSQDLAKREHIKRQLTYYPNSGLYSSGNQLRYIEYFYVDSRRQHHIVEIDNSPYLQKVLKSAAKGASLQELCNVLVDKTVSVEEAYAFLDELLESQVLTSALEPSVSGPPFVNQMIKVLRHLDSCQEEIRFLEQVAERFNAMDKQLGNKPEQYLQLSSFLKEQATTFELKFLFQTDLELSMEACQLSKEHLSQIKRALILFNRINQAPSESNLDRFKDAFFERYEEREMPLSHVLDIETGIGYLQNTGSGDINPLVDDLVLPFSEDPYGNRELKTNKFYAHLLEKLMEAQKGQMKVIRIKDADFQDFPLEWDDLPDTLSTMIELVTQKGTTKIRISGFGGSSAANLLGRFCHEQSKITPFTKSIVDKEQRMQPERILAEIVHLPEARVGNILMRPNFRDYEIPYLAQSIVPVEKQIPLEDLYISVRNNRIFLRSEKHNKEIVPRLTNAHNYSMNALPIYQFLCDLQTQGLRGGVGFNFGPLDPFFDFFPRVEFADCILQEAKWRIKKEEIEGLIRSKNQKEELNGQVQLFIENKAIPQYVMLSDGDNELLINFKNLTSVEMLLNSVKNREEFILKEFLHYEDSVVTSEKGHFANQVVVSFYNQGKMQSVSSSQKELMPMPKRSFIIGSEWLYYKIYTGPKTSDTILSTVMLPLVQHFKAQKWIDKWFFIRYADPKHHLRVRFLIRDKNATGEIVEKLFEGLRPLFDEDIIWKVQIDTYHRELERYGENTMELSESLFYYDSEATTKFLDLIEGDEGEQLRWLFGLRATDNLLTAFEYSLEDKMQLMEGLKIGFGREFNMSRPLKKQLDDKFRKEREGIESFMAFTLEDEPEYGPILEILEEANSRIGPIAYTILEMVKEGALQRTIDSLMGSYIHMLMNRLFKSKNRLNEMVCYDFLFRYYKSLLAKEKVLKTL
nr:lantibiotic dehydratase [Allomuricauda sp.]